MKKVLIVLILILCVSSVWSGEIQDDLVGQWTVSPFLIETENGLVVNPDAVYAYPHLGITELSFVDSGFIILKISGSEYRGFYDIEVLDYDNYNIHCMLKNDEQFLLKLVRAGTEWKFLYRIGQSSVLSGNPQDPPAVAETTEGPEEIDVPEESEPESYSIYTGFMKRKQ